MWGRKDKGRREPHFDAADDDFRLTPEDRPGVFVTEKKRKPKKTRQRVEPEWDTDDGEAPSRHGKSRSRAKKRTSSKSTGKKPQAKERSFFGTVFYWASVLGIWAVLGVGALLVWYAVHLPPLSTLQVPERPPNIAIVAQDGTLLVNRGARGQAVPLKEMSPYLPQAVIAIEDRNFYHHFGVDPLGLGRAVVNNVMAGGVQQGGSTVTQQLAKNVFLTPERSMERKIQELILSFWLETKFSKDEIMEMYLNRVYLGAGTYGAEAASQRYFGKSVRDINLNEAAILAGLLKAPSRYAPTRSANTALARAKTVLAAMVETGVITQAQADKAAAQKLVPAKISSATDSVNYAADWVMDLLPGFIETIDSDITVETTLNSKLQTSAETAVRDILNLEGEKYGVSQAAVVSMSPSGAVEALVGGRSYQDSQYNRAVIAKRQPGSSFKPFVYLAALERGLTPDDQRPDAPLNIKGWRPENYSRQYRGNISLREALALSLNTVAVRLALEVGPKAAIQVAQRLGITSKLSNNASIALGTSEVTLLDMTRAYAPFANGGLSVVPYVVTAIKDKDGNILYQRRPPRTGIERVVSPQHLLQMNDMLSAAVVFGTARKAQVPGWPLAGKTGTSQDFRDGWFMGFTPNMVTGVWVGNDDGTPTKRASGSNVPIDIWNRVMQTAHAGVAVKALPGVDRIPQPQQQQQNEPTIDDILIGGWGEENTGATHRKPQRECPLDSGFLNCVFGN
ncbi:MAG: PBP1A family penicillin-binding protein [Pseudomonadota bacterium]